MSLRRSVLVVDRDLSWTGFCRQTLQDNGYDVHVAPRPDACMNSLQHDAYDAILVATHLDGLCPLAGFAQIRQVASEAAVAAMASSYDPEYARQAYRLGAADYVMKTYQRNDITKAVEAMCVGRRSDSESAGDAVG
jgi:DNA-binding NtrC family response regulator